jgi:hypothetical protein
MSIVDPAQIPNAFKIKTSHYIIASLSLVTALSWNEAMKNIIKKIYVLPKDVAWGNVLYALFITLVLIIVIHMLPDTKSELPAETQAKINHLEAIERMRALQEKVAQLQARQETR